MVGFTTDLNTFTERGLNLKLLLLQQNQAQRRVVHSEQPATLINVTGSRIRRKKNEADVQAVVGSTCCIGERK
jgi:hypothetical protein